MQKITDLNSGIYLLEIFASEPFKVEIDNFKDRTFLPGYYYYSGSAQKNLEQRVERHQSDDKSIHWHIDFVTAIHTNKILNVFVFDGARKNYECDLVKELVNDFKLRYAVKGFGNTDCRRCVSHLLFSRRKIAHSHFISRYQSTVRLIPASKLTD